MKVVQSDNQVKFYTYGPTQVRSSELSDGIHLVVTEKELQNETLAHFANRQYGEIKQDPETNISPLKKNY